MDIGKSTTAYKISFFSTQAYDRSFFEKYNANFGFQLEFFDTQLNLKTVQLITDSSIVCVFVNDCIDAEVIAELAAKKVEIIALRCAGFNNVDFEAAKKHNIRVCRVPAYSPQAVAEHAMAMILTLNRKTHKAYNRVRDQNFSLNGLLGFDLFGKTIGVIGTGNIGKSFARIAIGFGCKVLAFDVVLDPQLEQLGVEYTDLNTLFKQSDIISLHCPLNENTKHIIDVETLSVMKKNVMIINTSRGGLIETSSVIDALKDEKVGYLGIDVYEQEEELFFKDLSANIIKDDVIQRLMSFPNVLVTAHQAFFTEEALTEIALVTLNNIQDLIQKNSIENKSAELV